MCIVMVTNLKEGTKSKCEQYWPNGRAESEEYGPFTVTLLVEYVMPDTVTRNISVKVTIAYFYLHIDFFTATRWI